MKIDAKTRKGYKQYKKDWIKSNTTASERGNVEAAYEDTIREMCVLSDFDFSIQSKIYTFEMYLRENDGYNGKMYMSLEEYAQCT